MKVINSYAELMCGRYSFFESEQIYERYDVPKLKKKISDRFNISPSQEAPVIVDDGEKHIELKPFGITAPWDEKKRLINARAETVHEKTTFAKKLEQMRCLVPATGYIEWQRSGDKKQPYFFHVKGMPIFSMAGIYGDSGFVILTTSASKKIEEIHDRMPVMLDEEEEADWLNPDASVEQVLKLLDPFHGNIEFWPVSTLVNSPQNDNSKVIAKVKT